MKTILPVARDTSGRGPRRIISRAASRAQRKEPVRLTPITVFHCSSDMSVTGASRCSPAFETRMSIVPQARSIAWNIARTSSSRATSARTAMASTPCFVISATTASAASGLET